ncbi:MAG: hypothetical protein ACK5DE_02255 [Bacteroidota bacterium]|jgi:hypothetical protein
MKIIEQFTLVKAEARLAHINSWVQNAPQLYAVEYYSSFDAFVDHLKSNVTTANAAVQAEDAKQDSIERAKLMYVAAIYRDCKYSLMHRGRLQELGINNMYREAYEVGRFAKLSQG